MQRATSMYETTKKGRACRTMNYNLAKIYITGAWRKDQEMCQKFSMPKEFRDKGFQYHGTCSEQDD